MAISVTFDGKLIKQLGSYVKTDLSAVRQINGVATGVVGILGLAEGGEPNIPYKITSYAEALAIFRGGPLVDHIQALFLGGAGEVVATRLAGDGISPSSVDISLRYNSTPTLYTLGFRSLEKSSRANSIFVQMLYDDKGTSTGPTSSLDDIFVLSLYQKDPVTCAVYKEVYELPRFFSKDAILVRRNDNLFFVGDWVIDNAKYNCQLQAANPKFLVKYATNANIANLADVDVSSAFGSSVTLSSGDLVLVKNQTTPEQNGIYLVTVTGTTVSLARAANADTTGEIVPGDVVAVQPTPTASITKYYVIEPTTTSTITIGSTPIVFALLPASQCNPVHFKKLLTSLLQETLFPDDQIQRFNAGDPVPLGLLMYEVNRGGLFGYEKSRIVYSTVNSAPNSNVLEMADIFSPTPVPFFNGTTYTLPDNSVENIVKVDWNLDNLITYNTDVLSNVYALFGGSNGNDGTGYYTPDGTVNFSNAVRTAWINGLQVFENEEVNFIQPAYRFHKKTPLASRESLFSGVVSLFIAHAQLMSQVQNRKRRTVIYGYPAPENEKSYSANVYLNGGGSPSTYGAIKVVTSLASSTDRAQGWIAPFKSIVFTTTGQEEILGGEFFASYMAGKHANRSVEISVTFEPVSGIGAKFLYNWTYVEKDTLISNRIAFVEKVKNSFGAELVRVHHNPTAWLGAVTQGYQEFVLRRIDDFVSTYIYKNVEQQWIGRQSYGKRTADAIKSYVETLLQNLNGKQISAYRDVVVTPNEDNTVYNVEFWFQPVTEIKFVLVTMKVSFNLA